MGAYKTLVIARQDAYRLLRRTKGKSPMLDMGQDIAGEQAKRRIRAFLRRGNKSPVFAESDLLNDFNQVSNMRDTQIRRLQEMRKNKRAK